MNLEFADKLPDVIINGTLEGIEMLKVVEKELENLDIDEKDPNKLAQQIHEKLKSKSIAVQNFFFFFFFSFFFFFEFIKFSF